MLLLPIVVPVRAVQDTVEILALYVSELDHLPLSRDPEVGVVLVEDTQSSVGELENKSKTVLVLHPPADEYRNLPLVHQLVPF